MTDQHDDHQTTASGQAGQVPPPPRAPGDVIGAYVIVRVIDPAGRRYLARHTVGETGTPSTALPGAGPASPSAEPVFQLLERAPGGHDAVRPVLDLELRHPRLLGLREIVTRNGRDYLVMDAVGDGLPAGAAPAPPLDAAGALAAGVGLADALSFLHRHGVVHLRVSPDAVAIHDGRAQLCGLEHAETTHPADPQAQRLFARDANFLARTLGLLASVGEEVPASAGAPASALSDIVRRAVASEFGTPDEVGAICSVAVPTHVVELPEAGPSLASEMTFLTASATSVGRVRTQNQDAAAAAVFEVRDDLSDQPGATTPAGVFLVADGMGGEARGELASRIACRVVVAEVTRGLLLPVVEMPIEPAVAGLTGADGVLPSLTDALTRAGRAANARIRDLSTTLGKPTGTTLTAIATIAGRAALVHVGDSRAYLLRAGKLIQLSEDHSLLARLQALDHPLLSDPNMMVPRSYLYRALGQEADNEVEATPLTLASGDRLLICSDGLWDEVPEATLLGLLAGGGTPRQCATALVAAADEAGGSDNSTAVVVFVQGPEPDTAPGAASA